MSRNYKPGPKSPTRGRHGKREPLDSAFWSARKIKGLELLLLGRLPQHVADELKVHHTTVYSWMRQEPFAAELAQAHTDMIASAKGVLVAYAGDAAQSVIDLSHSGRKQDFTKLKAATEILDRAGVVTAKQVAITTHTDLETMTDEQLEARLEAQLQAIRGSRDSG